VKELKQRGSLCFCKNQLAVDKQNWKESEELTKNK
jgi:hypothetical protein